MSVQNNLEVGLDTSIFSAPWETILAAAAGYAGYYVANIGIRDHHKTIDIAFSTLVFGFLSLMVYGVVRVVSGWGIIEGSAVAFASAPIAGALWCRWGRGLLARILRAGDISHANDLPNAWVELFTTTGFLATQLSVKLTDGTWLKCEQLHRFKDAPNGPCKLGTSGDLLMYVTHVMSSGDEDFEETSSVVSPDWGDEITYIPASQIARVDFRRKPAKSRTTSSSGSEVASSPSQ